MTENLQPDMELCSTKYKAGTNYILRKIADANVLISVGANIANFNGYMQLNGSALTLWKRLAEPATIEELAISLTDAYGIPMEAAVQDASEFLETLKAHDMVTVEPEQCHDN